MSLDTYGELKTQIAAYMERSDLTSQIPVFIGLAQAKMYRGERDPSDRQWLRRPLRVANMVTTGDITVTNSTASLPANWLEFIRLYPDASGYNMVSYVPPENFWNLDTSDESGVPLFYTIEGATMRFQPLGSATIKGAWYAKFTAMSADSDADWVMANAPHVYLHGALSEAFRYEGNRDRAAEEKTLFDMAVNGLMGEDQQARTSGSILTMRPRSVA